MPLQISQFGDRSIPFTDAVSLCGPAAAVAFAKANGRNPTLGEARDLAKRVGWTAESGMAGPGSQQRLLALMGVQAELRGSADWGRIRAEVAQGKPVTVSTPRHYFTLTGYDPATGTYDVGASGTDLKGGKERMSADEITAAGRGINGVLHFSGTPARERQQFLEANAPGEGATSVPSPGAAGPRPAAVPPVAEAPAGVPSTTDTAREAEKAERERRREEERARRAEEQAFYRRLMAGYEQEDPSLPVYRLPAIEPLPTMPGF